MRSVFDDPISFIPELSFTRSYLLQSSRWNNTFVHDRRGAYRAVNWMFFINVEMILPPSVVYLLTYLLLSQAAYHANSAIVLVQIFLVQHNF